MLSNVAQARYLISVARPLIAELDDQHLALEPGRGLKTAGWLIGHLVVTGDFARGLCGREPLCPRAWGLLFRPGSHPSAEQNDYPSMEELRLAFFAVYEDLCRAALDADPAHLSRDNPYAPGRDAFPTAGDFVGYLLAAHLGYHVGQLVSWRAATRIEAHAQGGRQVEPGRAD